MMLVHTCLNCILFLGIFVLVANAVNSEETTVQNATQINNQTCPMRVKGHLVNLMDEHLNDVSSKYIILLENVSFFCNYFQARPQIEASVINATRLMLEEEFVPDVTYKFNQEISVTGGFLHQHTEKLALELRREVNRVEIKFDAVVTQKNREIEELRTEHENLKLTCENLEVKTTRIEREYKAADTTMNNKNRALQTSLNGLVIAPLGTINAWVTKPSKSSSSSRTLPTCKKIISTFYLYD